MDILEFISSVISTSSLAWPIAILMLVLILRKPVENLLLDLKRFRYGDMEIDFSKEVRELEAKAHTAGLKLPKPTERKVSKQNSVQILADAERLVADFPEPAVGLAWTALENELMQGVMRLAISPDYTPYNSSFKNIELLQDQGYLDKETRALLDRMRNLRNAAVHPNRYVVQITADEAQEYIVLAKAITDKLRQISR